jgi:hypothetical protein
VYSMGDEVRCLAKAVLAVSNQRTDIYSQLVA